MRSLVSWAAEDRHEEQSNRSAVYRQGDHIDELELQRRRRRRAKNNRADCLDLFLQFIQSRHAVRAR